jgi:hypothetical protein
VISQFFALLAAIAAGSGGALLGARAVDTLRAALARQR